MTEDSELLRQFLEYRSETAFSEFVHRHIDFVYFAALRRVGGDSHMAEDVTQGVFADLARKATSLKDRSVLTGWLYTSTRFAAAQAVRSERRRRNREQEAHAMQELDFSPECDWEKLQPIIDRALDQLNDRDREIVLLRFFQHYSLTDIGLKYAQSPDAARMRIDRALEKLRKILARHGITSTTAALTAIFVNQSGVAAPAGLVAKIVSTALSQTAVSSAAVFGLWKIIAGVSIASLGIGFVVYEGGRSRLPASAPVAHEDARDKPGSAQLLAVQSAIPAHGRLKIDAKQVAAREGKLHRTTDDFGWPQVGLFAGDISEPPRHTIAEFRIKMEEDADFRAVVTEQARDHLGLFYGYLFKALDLRESQLDRLKNLLLEKERLKIDAYEAQKVVGDPEHKDRALIRAGINQGQQAIDEEIRAVLGDSHFATYLEYRSDLVQWTAVNEVARKLQATPTPLSDEQARRLVVLLRKSLLRLHFPYTFDICCGAGLFSGHIGSALSEDVFLRASGFLSEPQTNALRELKRPRTVQSDAHRSVTK